MWVLSFATTIHTDQYGQVYYDQKIVSVHAEKPVTPPPPRMGYVG